MKLTDKEIKQLKGGKKERVLNDGAGLYLRVYPSGRKEWRFRYKMNNVPKWFFLGSYPYLSLADARLKAHEQKANVRNGLDPAELKKESDRVEKEALARQKSRITIQELFNRWVQFDIGKRKDNGKEVIRCFQKDILPTIGGLAAEDVNKGHIAVIVDTCLSRGSDRMAKVILSLIRQMFRFAQDRDIVDIDPTSSIRKHKIGKPDSLRDRFLTDEEITELGQKVELAGLNEATKIAIWIALATGCRIGELIKSRWAEIDLEKRTWLVTPENSKNGKQINIHLSNFALTQFKKLSQIQPKSPWAYPNRTNKGHLDTKTITKQIGDRQSSSKTQLSKRTKHSTALLLKGGKWTPHDLRRTAATTMTALGVLPDIADRCLNHLEQNKIRRTYLQHSYTKEMVVAWDLLGDHLVQLIQNNK